ncbi:RDD family protein [Candidatus Laterigemmans baculatus]|uniref:RDD family protein n=1 Tax=Candidatus Laterigemmans baculatus TaxID=2770505 RepID=UPI0013DABD9F|nr:RDD family protein [Candidatus Laterigemmans baculatus]
MSANPYSPTATTLDASAPLAAEGAQLATRGERLLGAIIDTVVLLMFVFPVTFAVGFGLAIAGLGELPDFVFDLIGGVAGMGGFLILHGYLLATRGQTIGKIVMKTQIVDRETNQILPIVPLLIKRYSWVWLVTMIPGIGQLINLVNVLAIFRESRACVHDDVAGTKVVKLTRPIARGPQY